MQSVSYTRHRFPSVVIQHAVWLYLRFTLSYRDVEDLLAERGLDISSKAERDAAVRRCAVAEGFQHKAEAHLVFVRRILEQILSPPDVFYWRIASFRCDARIRRLLTGERTLAIPRGHIYEFTP